LCPACPLAATCLAKQQGTSGQLPVKLRRTEPVQLQGVLLVVRRGGRVLLRQRDGAARRMAGFWDLPSPDDLPSAKLGAELGTFRHTITHHHYTFTVTAASGKVRGPACRWFAPAEMGSVPLSTTARKGLQLAGVL
jgi:A/G-specific adenine glycosylase